MMHLKKPLFPIFAFLISIIGFLGYTMLNPQVSNVGYANDTAEHRIDLPFLENTTVEKFVVRFDMYQSFIGIQKYKFIPDNCIEKLVINEKIVNDPQLPFCDTKGRILDIGQYLHHGSNVITVFLRDEGVVGGFNIKTAKTEAVVITAITTTIIFYLIGIISLILLYKSEKSTKRKVWLSYGILALIAITGIAIRLFLTPSISAGGDMWLNKGWTKSATILGPIKSYSQQIDGVALPNYPPFSIFLYWIAGESFVVLKSTNFDSNLHLFEIFVKMPGMLADIGIVLMLFFVVRRTQSAGWGLLASACYAFHPVPIYLSAVWGQTDSIYTLLVLITLYALSNRQHYLVGIFATLAILTKPQSIAFLPLLLLLSVIINRRLIPWKLLLGIISAASAVLLPFFVHGRIDRVLDVYSGYIGSYPYLSMGAYNAWWALFGEAQVKTHDTSLFIGQITYRQIGIAIFIASYIAVTFSFRRYIKKKIRFDTKTFLTQALFALTAITGIFFSFNTEMHERYLFPLLVFGIPIALRYTKTIPLYLIVSTTFLLNLLGVFPYTIADRWLFSTFPTIKVAIATITTTIAILYFIKYIKLFRR